jgi:phytoene synthase
VLRSVPALAARGRCLLPLDALAAEGLAPEAVVAAPEAAAVRRVVATMARSALDTLLGLRHRLRGLPRGTLAAALPLVLARRDLRRLAAGRIVPAERGFGTGRAARPGLTRLRQAPPVGLIAAPAWHACRKETLAWPQPRHAAGA